MATGTERFSGDHFDGGAHLTDGTLDKHLNRDQTIHFDVGRVANPEASTPGVPDVNALSVFGQLNVHKDRKIAAIHLHMIKGASSGAFVVEVYRRRDGTMTRIATLELDASEEAVPDFATAAAVPTDPDIKAGDYLMAQATDVSLVASGNANGLTVDIHFAAD